MQKRLKNTGLECIVLTASVARWLWPKSGKWCHKNC